jgi:WD40 repeat protein
MPYHLDIIQQAQLLGHKASVYAVEMQSVRSVLTGGGEGWIVAWDLDAPENGRLLATVETSIFSMRLLPERGLLLAGNRNGGLHWIDWHSKREWANVAHHQKGVFDILWHNALGLLTAGGDGRLTLWDVANARPMESLQLSRASLRCLACSPNDGTLAVGASDGNIYLLDASLNQKARIEGAHRPSVFTLAFVLDGQRLLSGGRDALLKAWDLAAGNACLNAQPAHLFTINHIALSPSGRLFATASRDKTLKIWNTASMELLKVVDVRKSSLLEAPMGHFNSVNRLLWVDEGCLVSVSDDRTALVWGIEGTNG